MIYEVSKLHGSKIIIGQRGENLATTIQIDVSEWLAKWPNSTFNILIKRPGDIVPYVTSTSLSGNILSWPVTGTDTENAGTGKIEVRATLNGVIKKSAIVTIGIAPCILCGENEQPPELAPAVADLALEAAIRAENAAMRIAESRAYDHLDNSDFRAGYIVNQRGVTVNTKHGEYLHDRWKSEAANNESGIIKIDSGGVTLMPSASNYCGIVQVLEHYGDMIGKTYTIAVCVNGIWHTGSFVWGGMVSGGVLLNNGLRIYNVSSNEAILIRNPAGNSSITIQRVALYEGTYTADTLPEYLPKGYAAELAECQRYYHLYATQDARPAHGMDCSPPMRINAPTQGAITIDGTVYYYNAADL